MNKPTIFYVVRHGETFWNVDHRIQGHTDNPLSEKGEQQAKELADLLAHVHFDAFYSSDLIRARKTAEILAAQKKPVTTSEQLRERKMGQLEGKMIGKEISYEDFAAWFDQHDNPERQEIGIESDIEVMERFMAFLKQLHNSHQGKTLLIASHASMMKALLVTLRFGSHAELPGRTIKNTAFVKICFDGEKFSVLETSGITKTSITKN